MLTVGQTVSHYRILERIGGGGMGDVYKALDTRLERTVALKVLPPDAVRDPERRRRFTQEAKAASALDHPNIVVVHDIGEDQGVHFIAMQYVAGATLQERLCTMKLSEALGYAIQMADALAVAHAHGIVHRDLKPANVVVTEQGVAKILDFGVAKLTELGDSEDAPTRDQGAPLTREGNIIGTAAYMSPEQAEGRKVDARSDIFSFGSVLYEMVTGTKAFAGTSLPSILAAVLRDEPRPLSERLPKAPLELERLLTRALRKDPGRRFQSRAILRSAIDHRITVVNRLVTLSLLPPDVSVELISPLRREAGRSNRMKTYTAEFFGTFWLVFGGCGSAVLAAAFPEVGIGLLGVSLAFGLTVVTMAYAVGHISGGHFNPAVSVGLWAGGRFPKSQVLPYVAAQVAGAIVAGGVLYLVASGKPGFDVSAGFAANGFGEHSPGGYSLVAGLVVEVVMTMMFLVIILGTTSASALQGFAPLAIGLGLTLIHLVSIPVTNTSVNPARSTGVALFASDWALAQLWLFWVAPIAGALIGAMVYRFIGEGEG